MLLGTRSGNIGQEPRSRRKDGCHLGRLVKEEIAAKEKWQGL